MLTINPEIGIAANGDLTLRFTRGETLGHTVTIPCDDKGLRLIKLVLVARSRGETKLGQAGNPTQSMIQAWLASDKFNREQAKIEAERQVVAELVSIF